MIEIKRFCKYCRQSLPDLNREICEDCKNYLDEYYNSQQDQLTKFLCYHLFHHSPMVLLSTSLDPQDSLLLIITSTTLSIIFHPDLSTIDDLSKVQFRFTKPVYTYIDEILKFLSIKNISCIIIKNASNLSDLFLHTILNTRNSSLRHLIFTNSNLTKIPSVISNMKSLETLNLSKNKITKIPKSIGKLINLKYLNLSHNEIQSLPISMKCMRQLKNVNISNNKIKNIGSIFEKIEIKKVKYSNNPLENIFFYNKTYLERTNPKIFKKKKVIKERIKSGILDISKEV